MSPLRLLARRFKRRFLGAHYCDIRSRSGHAFEWIGPRHFRCICGAEAIFVIGIGLVKA